MGVNAGVAKLVDAPDLGSGAFGVGVQVPPPAPQNSSNNRAITIQASDNTQ